MFTEALSILLVLVAAARCLSHYMVQGINNATAYAVFAAISFMAIDFVIDYLDRKAPYIKRTASVWLNMIALFILGIVPIPSLFLSIPQSPLIWLLKGISPLIIIIEAVLTLFVIQSIGFKIIALQEKSRDEDWLAAFNVILLILITCILTGSAYLLNKTYLNSYKDVFVGEAMFITLLMTLLILIVGSSAIGFYKGSITDPVLSILFVTIKFYQKNSSYKPIDQASSWSIFRYLPISFMANNAIIQKIQATFSLNTVLTLMYQALLVILASSFYKIFFPKAQLIVYNGKTARTEEVNRCESI